MSETGRYWHYRKTGEFTAEILCDPITKSEILAALQKQAEDRIVEKLIRSAEEVLEESEKGGPNRA